METKELERLLAAAELRNPQGFSADRERYLAEISFKAGQQEVAECVNGFMVLHSPDMWRRKLSRWGIRGY